jgi:protocatechuate 3,4-dioxygenase beta subunit
MQVRPPGCDYAVGIGVTVGDGYHPGGAKVDSWVPIDLYSEAQAVNVDVLDRLVTGRVVDVDDRAVPDARVEVNFTRRSKVEAGGRFAVWVSTKGESGFAFVTARAVGHGVGAAAVPRATEDASEVVIRLAPERTLEIRVIDEQGGPVAGARVVGTVNLQPQNPPKGLNVELGVLLGSRTTDAEGRVRFAKIPAPTAEGLGENAEQLQLRLKKAGYATQQVSLHVGSRAAPLRVVLERPRQLKGRIVDASGAGVVGARMRLLMSPGGVEVEVAPKASSEEFAAGGPQVAVSNVRVTDGQGGFSYDGVAAGDYHLDVFGPGVIPRIVRVSVPGEELLISVERSVPFTGLVVDEAGRPVADVAIEIYPSQSLAGMSVDDYFNDADSSGFPERLGGARTDDEGRFSAEGVASGHFDVFMNGRYEQKIVCDVSSGQLRPLTFPRTQVADVLFRPIAAESGRRLRNLKVVVYDASGARLYATSWGNQDPSYRATLKLNSGDVGDVFVEEPGIELRAAGALRLELSAPGRVPVVVPVSARLGSQVNLGEIPMPKGGGRVRFKVLADAPLAVASVTFVTAEGLRHKEFVEGGPVELTLAPGALTFELHAWTITDGDFEITPETAIKRSVTVSVVTGETRDVVFDLRGE